MLIDERDTVAEIPNHIDKRSRLSYNDRQYNNKKTTDAEDIWTKTRNGCNGQ